MKKVQSGQSAALNQCNMAERKIKYLNMKSVQHEKTWQHEKSAISEKTI